VCDIASYCSPAYTFNATQQSEANKRPNELIDNKQTNKQTIQINHFYCNPAHAGHVGVERRKKEDRKIGEELYYYYYPK
jgi:hypothetical protein